MVAQRSQPRPEHFDGVLVIQVVGVPAGLENANGPTRIFPDKEFAPLIGRRIWITHARGGDTVRLDRRPGDKPIVVRAGGDELVLFIPSAAALRPILAREFPDHRLGVSFRFIDGRVAGIAFADGGHVGKWSFVLD